jgi:hypothetical protein
MPGVASLAEIHCAKLVFTDRHGFVVRATRRRRLNRQVTGATKAIDTHHFSSHPCTRFAILRVAVPADDDLWLPTSSRPGSSRVARTAEQSEDWALTPIRTMTKLTLANRGSLSNSVLYKGFHGSRRNRSTPEPECRRQLIVVYHNDFSVNCLAQDNVRFNTKLNGFN